MRLQCQVLAALLLAMLAAQGDARRVRVSRVRPVAETEDDLGPLVDQDGDQQQVQYYAAGQDDRADTRSGRVVLLSPELYAGVQGRAVTRAPEPVYRASPRALAAQSVQAQSTLSRQGKEHTKAPPVQTIRNYSKVNDDGSFTFGYEAADGSFKEETRGTDCVVRGKYGYVDPDGNKREFTYVSGNPCDPNAVNQEEEQDRPAAGKDEDAGSGEENVPANFPTRAALRTLRPAPAPRPSTTLFQQSFSQDSDEDVEEDDVPAVVPVRSRVVRPTPTPSSARPRLIVTTPRPTTSLYQSTASSSATTAQPSVRITPRPYSSTTTTEPPATTYRPQAVQVSVTPRPGSLYSSKPLQPIRSSTPGTIDFAEELRKFQLDNNVVVTTERPDGSGQRPKGSDPIYSTELVFDPQSGQYNTVVYQSLPKPQDISQVPQQVQRHRLQPYVAQPQPQPLQQQHSQPPTLYQQQLVQQQQAALLQQSQNLYAQQQRQLQHQQQRSLAAATAYQAPRYQPQLQQVSSTASPVKLAPAPQQPRYIPQAQPVQYAPGPSGPPQTQFYYVSPQDAGDQRAALAAGQIDAFLRGHNLAF